MKKPFMKPCYFCQKEVKMQKDQTEGKAVACFDCSPKFMDALKSKKDKV
jgi:DNA-directed RNA polymerase subunit RPC12/RpoP